MATQTIRAAIYHFEQMRISIFIARYWPSLLTLAVILYATLASDPAGADQLPPIPHLDKAIHAIMMGGLVGAIAFDTQRAERRRSLLTPRLMWTIWLGVATFSLCDELAQGLVAERGTSFADFIADLVGAVAAVYLAPPAIRAVLKIK